MGAAGFRTRGRARRGAGVRARPPPGRRLRHARPRRPRHRRRHDDRHLAPVDRRHPGRRPASCGSTSPATGACSTWPIGPAAGGRGRHHPGRSQRARRCAPCRTPSACIARLPRTKGPGGGDQATTFADDATAALALWGDRLAWRVTYRASSTAVWNVVVDAGQRPGPQAREPRQVRGVRAWSGRTIRARPPVAQRGSCRSRSVAVGSTTQLLGAVRARVLGSRRQRRRRRGRRGRARVVHVQCRQAASAARPTSSARGSGAGATWTTNRQTERGAGVLLRQPLPRSPRCCTDRLRRVHATTIECSYRPTTAPRPARTTSTSTTRTCTRRRTVQSPVMQMYLFKSTVTETMNGGDDAFDPLPRVHAWPGRTG